MAEFAFLFDVDNTLLDNDRAKSEMQTGVERCVGRETAARFWSLYEEVRAERDFVDYLETLARFRAERPREGGFPELAALILGYPYESVVYPGALDALAHCRQIGETAILSDGDPVYQAAKIGRAGLARIVGANVFIYVHKQQHLDEITKRLAADRLVLIDDKPGVLAACKLVLGERLVTVFVRQGKYAHVAGDAPAPLPDISLDSIAEVIRLGAADLRNAGIPADSGPGSGGRPSL